MLWIDTWRFGGMSFGHIFCPFKIYMVLFGSDVCATTLTNPNPKVTDVQHCREYTIMFYLSYSSSSSSSASFYACYFSPLVALESSLFCYYYCIVLYYTRYSLFTDLHNTFFSFSERTASVTEHHVSGPAGLLCCCCCCTAVVLLNPARDHSAAAQQYYSGVCSTAHRATPTRRPQQQLITQSHASCARLGSITLHFTHVPKLVRGRCSKCIFLSSNRPDVYDYFGGSDFMVGGGACDN